MLSAQQHPSVIDEYLAEEVRLGRLLPLPWPGTSVQISIRCRCENMAVVHDMASRYSREYDLMHLLRCLFFFEAYFDFSAVAEHIPGAENGLADDLSRNRLDSYLLQVPEASKSPVPICPVLVELLLDSGAQWNSPTWISQFSSTVGRE